MWCHLCIKDYKTFEEFRIHIMKVHGNTSELSRESSECEESEHEHAEDSETYNNDENVALNASPEICHYSDHSSDIENKFEDNTTALNFLSEKQDHSDDSLAEENNSTSALNTSLEKCNDDDENKASVLNIRELRKRRSCSKNENNSDANTAVSNKMTKCKKSSILKKCAQKKKKKVAFSKKILPKRRKSAASYQKSIPEDSDDDTDTDHSTSSFNQDNDFNSQPLLNSNYFNPQSVPVNYVNTQPICNNPVFLVNPYAGQSVNNYLIGNQAIQPPVYVADPVITKPTTMEKGKGFVFNSKNILQWLIKHKEFSKNICYPVPQSLFNTIKTVHKAIFDHYCTASSNKEEISAVLKVYEELDCMIQKHINSINNALSY